MADDEALAWASFLVTALGTVFMGISALKGISARIAAAKANIVGLREPLLCPNCGQPFDTWAFPRVNGRRTVTCPRCSQTFEA